MKETNIGFDETVMLRYAIVILSSCLLISPLVDSVMLVLSRGVAFQPYRMLLLRDGEWLFAPAIIVPFYLGSTLGWRGLFVITFGLSISYFIFTNCRGPWIWRGYFDHYEANNGLLQSSWLLGVVSGLGVWSLRVARSTTGVALSNRGMIGAVLVLAATGILVALEIAIYRIDSAFPPTLHFAVLTEALILSGFAWWVAK